jgi:hypothetical protein
MEEVDGRVMEGKWPSLTYTPDDGRKVNGLFIYTYLPSVLPSVPSISPSINARVYKEIVSELSPSQPNSGLRKRLAI